MPLNLTELIFCDHAKKKFKLNHIKSLQIALKKPQHLNRKNLPLRKKQKQSAAKKETQVLAFAIERFCVTLSYGALLFGNK